MPGVVHRPAWSQSARRVRVDVICNCGATYGREVLNLRHDDSEPAANREVCAISSRVKRKPYVPPANQADARSLTTSFIDDTVMPKILTWSCGRATRTGAQYLHRSPLPGHARPGIAGVQFRRI